MHVPAPAWVSPVVVVAAVLLPPWPCLAADCSGRRSPGIPPVSRRRTNRQASYKLNSQPPPCQIFIVSLVRQVPPARPPHPPLIQQPKLRPRTSRHEAQRTSSLLRPKPDSFSHRTKRRKENWFDLGFEKITPNLLCGSLKKQHQKKHPLLFSFNVMEVGFNVHW